MPDSVTPVPPPASPTESDAPAAPTPVVMPPITPVAATASPTPQPAAPQLPHLERWETLTAELLGLISRLRNDWDQSLLREYLDKRAQAPAHVREQVLNKRQP